MALFLKAAGLSSLPLSVIYIFFLSKSFTTTVEVSVRENSLKCCYFERHLVPLLLVMKGRKKRSFWSTKFTTVGQWLIVVKLAPFNLLKTFTPRGSLWSTNQESFPHQTGAAVPFIAGEQKRCCSEPGWTSLCFSVNTCSTAAQQGTAKVKPHCRSIK